MIKIKNYINGQFIKPESNEYVKCYTPHNEKQYALCPRSNKADLNLAIKSSKKANIF